MALGSRERERERESNWSTPPFNLSQLRLTSVCCYSPITYLTPYDIALGSSLLLLTYHISYSLDIALGERERERVTGQHHLLTYLSLD